MKVLIVTGSSGGHIFPALSLLNSLKGRHKATEVLLVLPKSNLGDRIIFDNAKVKYISTSSFGGNGGLKNLAALFNFFRGSLESFIILLEFRPEVEIGFGSINCIALVFFARILRIKTLIHEQNVIPGRANRLLAHFCDRVAVSFRQTSNYWDIGEDKLILSGNPLRQELERIDKTEALNFFGFKEGPSDQGQDKFRILVMGGSQGSHKINAVFVKALSLIPGINRFQVIHITGAQDLDSAARAYDQMGLEVKVFSFLKEMQYAYSVCDLAISRAGATTIRELIFFKLPAIIIPYPFAYKHQQANAGILKEEGAAVVISDEELRAEILSENITRIVASPGRAQPMRAAYGNISMPDAGTTLTEAVLSLTLN